MSENLWKFIILYRRLWINVNDINNRLTICHVYNILIVLSAHQVHICKHGFMFHGLFCENLTRNVPVFPIVHCWNQINLELMYINDFSMWLIPLIIYMKIPLRLYLDQYLAYLVSSNAMWISKRFSLTYVSLLVWVWLIRVIIQFRTRIRNHTHCFMWDVINQIFNGGSTRPPH